METEWSMRSRVASPPRVESSETSMRRGWTPRPAPCLRRHETSPPAVSNLRDLRKNVPMAPQMGSRLGLSPLLLGSMPETSGGRSGPTHRGDDHGDAAGHCVVFIIDLPFGGGSSGVTRKLEAVVGDRAPGRTEARRPRLPRDHQPGTHRGSGPSPRPHSTSPGESLSTNSVWISNPGSELPRKSDGLDFQPSLLWTDHTQ